MLEGVKMEQKKYLYSLSPCHDLTFWIVCCVAFPLKMKPRVSESDEKNSVDMMQNLTEHICTDTGFRYDTLFYSKPWRAIAEILYVNLRNSKPALLSRIKTDFFYRTLWNVPDSLNGSAITFTNLFTFRWVMTKKENVLPKDKRLNESTFLCVKISTNRGSVFKAKTTSENALNA